MKIWISFAALALGLVGYFFANRQWTGIVYLGGYEPKHKMEVGQYYFLRSCREAALAVVELECSDRWFYECGLNCNNGSCTEVSQ